MLARAEMPLLGTRVRKLYDIGTACRGREVWYDGFVSKILPEKKYRIKFPDEVFKAKHGRK